MTARTLQDGRLSGSFGDIIANVSVRGVFNELVDVVLFPLALEGLVGRRRNHDDVGVFRDLLERLAHPRKRLHALDDLCDRQSPNNRLSRHDLNRQ